MTIPESIVINYRRQRQHPTSHYRMLLLYSFIDYKLNYTIGYYFYRSQSIDLPLSTILFYLIFYRNPVRWTVWDFLVLPPCSTSWNRISRGIFSRRGTLWMGSARRLRWLFYDSNTVIFFLYSRLERSERYIIFHFN